MVPAALVRHSLDDSDAGMSEPDDTASVGGDAVLAVSADPLPRIASELQSFHMSDVVLIMSNCTDKRLVISSPAVSQRPTPSEPWSAFVERHALVEKPYTGAALGSRPWAIGNRQ